MSDTPQSSPKSESIIAVPQVLERRRRQKKLTKITSNGTIAAAVMVGAALLAVIVANSDAYEAVHHFLMEPLTLGIGPLVGSISIEAFVNDFLMAIFFLLVGIELKYEVTVGELRKPRQAALPMLAAVGGVVVPAAIYLLFNSSGSNASGWAIPMATDIAFALGVMSLLGDRVAPATKVFFSTLAIADDILAIIVIALFYGHAPSLAWLAASAGCLLILAVFNYLKVFRVRHYMIVGLLLWFCMFNSGIHATLAGVLLALFLPAKSDISLAALRPWLKKKADRLDDIYDDNMHILGQHEFMATSATVERIMHQVTPPLERTERAISVPVNFVILPIFAFVNAQVRLVGVDVASVFADPVTLGTMCGSILGKPIGIVAVTVLLVKIGFAKLPSGVDWHQIIGVGLMGGLGFTMSILIAGLAFTNPVEILAAKFAILCGSVIAATIGCLYILLTGKKASAGSGDSQD
ncbi:MAG: Na+/H+ antiporter NhaA [Atopobiaceae bacterium]|uniref:Na(+)/H(+) antiporter NhaA n=1 Tax=Muricaecibacterium torontonense TaxID=3032871 RepID=A0A4S2F766_9ACTN|nr:Na+/H+ antiporter NhaA [Muricaecibacterium torontonense]MCI8675137.1 Na+/H+ antiporter NhaA [Atopobiaceae bacterium]TGY63234.1 Na+/H+ antiporter NhaA [Muricaecibacterium torontonense]